jgi:hypothetical protein
MILSGFDDRNSAAAGTRSATLIRWPIGSISCGWQPAI